MIMNTQDHKPVMDAQDHELSLDVQGLYKDFGEILEKGNHQMHNLLGTVYQMMVP